MLSNLHHALAWLLDWSSYVLPAISNLILVFLGLIMSLPRLAQAIEDEPRHKKWLAAICLTFGLIGFAFDVSQRRSSDLTNTQLLQDTGTALKKTSTLIDNMGVLIASTNDMISRLGLMEPQIMATTDHLASIDKKLDIAKKQSNPELIAALQVEKQSALSTLLTMAPGIVAGMRYWANKWNMDDRTWEHTFNQVVDSLKVSSPQEMERFLDPIRNSRIDMNTRYTREILPMMTSANYLRQRLLRDSTPTQEDAKNAVIFSKVLAGEPINWSEMGQATEYMENLVKKFLPTAPLPPSHATVTVQ